MNYWQKKIKSPAIAAFSIINKSLLKLDVTNGGDERDLIQLLQDNVPLFPGVKYQFECSIGSTDMKVIEAYIEKNEPPWTNYGKIGPTVVNNQIKKYVYEFTMEDNTDLNARVVFNWGLNTGTFFLDDVKIFQKPITNIDENKS